MAAERSWAGRGWACGVRGGGRGFVGVRVGLRGWGKGVRGLDVGCGKEEVFGFSVVGWMWLVGWRGGLR